MRLFGRGLAARVLRIASGALAKLPAASGIPRREPCERRISRFAGGVPVLFHVPGKPKGGGSQSPGIARVDGTALAAPHPHRKDRALAQCHILFPETGTRRKLWGRLETCGGLLTRPKSPVNRPKAPVANRRAGYHPAPQLMQSARFWEKHVALGFSPRPPAMARPAPNAKTPLSRRPAKSCLKMYKLEGAAGAVPRYIALFRSGLF